MAVIKSNAYGHGMVDFAKEMASLGVDWFGVDDFAEAVSLRKAGLKNPILVLGFTPAELIPSAAKLDVSVTVSNKVALSALMNYKGKTAIKIHIKADTGLHRQGFQLSECKEISKISTSFKKGNVIIEGLYTHFASAESPSSPYSLRQLEEFGEWVKTFEKSNLRPICHTAGTAATILLPESHFDMVRVGIGLYGLWPSPEVKERAKNKIKLEPVLSWKVIVGDVKFLRKGDKIGYDLTEEIARDSRIAVCGIGYWHGFPRSLGSKGIVGVKGKSARVLGRVSMDIIALDVTDIPDVNTGDEAVIIGKSGGTYRSAEALAETAGTINYEIVTRINQGIPRFFV